MHLTSLTASFLAMLSVDSAAQQGVLSSLTLNSIIAGRRGVRLTTTIVCLWPPCVLSQSGRGWWLLKHRETIIKRGGKIPGGGETSVHHFGNLHSLCIAHRRSFCLGSQPLLIYTARRNLH